MDYKGKGEKHLFSYAKPLDFVAIIFLLAWFWEDGIDAWEGSHFSDVEVIFMAVIYHGILVFLVRVGWYERKQEAEKEKADDEKSKNRGQ